MAFRTISCPFLAALLWTGACAEIPPPAPEPAKVPVRSEVVQAAPFRPSLVIYGKSEPASRTEIRTLEGGRLDYAPRFAGGLRTGERVRQGEAMFAVVNEQLRLAHTEAALELQSAEAELERTRLGVEGGFLPAANLKRAEIAAELAGERLASAEKRLERLRWRAPTAFGRLLLDAFEIWMMREHLLGIKQRVEAQPSR